MTPDTLAAFALADASMPVLMLVSAVILATPTVVAVLAWIAARWLMGDE